MWNLEKKKHFFRKNEFCVLFLPSFVFRVCKIVELHECTQLSLVWKCSCFCVQHSMKTRGKLQIANYNLHTQQSPLSVCCTMKDGA